MPAPSHELLTEQLALADALLAGREKMFDPQDLPGRYGRVVRAIDRVELKIAAGRLKDKADVVELIRANAEKTESLRQHLLSIEASYKDQFDALVKEARKDDSPR